MFIHHHSAQPCTGGDEDSFDVIESDGEISIWHRSMERDFGFKSVEEAIKAADLMADTFDRRNDPDGTKSEGHDD